MMIDKYHKLKHNGQYEQAQHRATRPDRRCQEHDHQAAGQRLLDGTPLHSDGARTVVALATEAGVKRHVLTHRHTDLKDEFYARVRAQGQVPASETKVRDELAETKRKLAEALEHNKTLTDTVERLARMVNVLTVENAQLVEQQDNQLGRTLTPFRPRTTPPGGTG